ncbi:hypothetical protein ACQCT6_09355 [Cytobacillus gottheilii]|uniref:hypothetical protein n=1 Tax=Cytobacillus gottheilii TaxID=859144 RepID=UPI003CF35908
MPKYESYSFSRLLLNRNLEFFFILGVNNPDNFDEYWDGRITEVLGYAVIFNDFTAKDQKNFIYLLDKDNGLFDDIIKYTKKFIQQMTVSDKLSDWENFRIINTDIDGKRVLKPYEDFIKSVIKNEIPEVILDEIV